MIHSTPAAFRHVNSDSMLEKITAGVHEITDVQESIDRLLLNLVDVLKTLQKSAEASGHNPETTMDAIDEIRDVLSHRGHMIIAAIIRDTELDV